MPEKLKRYINKDFVQFIDKNFTKKELTEIIKYIAEKLSSRGLIKLAI